MKRFYLFILLMVGATSCIDEAYDLSQVADDDFAIGNDQSEFMMPLANITLTAEQLISESDSEDSDVVSVYQEADIWLPTELPGGADFVEVLLLQEDAAYLQSVLDALYAEMAQSESKRVAVCTLIAEKYREEFISVLSEDVPAEVRNQILTASVEVGANLIGELFMDPLMQASISVSVGEVAEYHLVNMQMKDVVYEIGDLGLSSDVEDMIKANLDPKGTEPVVNALYMAGTIDSGFPFYLLIYPHLDGTEVDLGPLRVTNEVTTIEEVRLYTEDIQVIFEGSTLTMPLRISRYYPNRGFNEQSEVHIHLTLRKTGSLKL